jgi:hypothetical protein
MEIGGGASFGSKEFDLSGMCVDYVWAALFTVFSRTMKWIGERCEVKTRPNRPVPYLFRWRETTWEVREVQEVWRKESKWWQASGPERRTYYRCTVHSGTAARGGHTVVELFRRELRGTGKQEWILARLAD